MPASSQGWKNAAAGVALSLAFLTAPSANGADTIPNFAPSAAVGWQLSDDEFIPPPSGPGYRAAWTGGKQPPRAARPLSDTASTALARP